MIQTITLIVTIFIGWLIFDFVKYKKLTKEYVITAFVSAVVAGVAYYLLFGLL